ncbi:hypothetical protein OsI_22069 [Oryza sativa Indica Group]|nr:hypothetical protein OsI_22069 [Oryza sativa Indica Group]
MWTCCTKLRFDGVMVSRDNINAILQQHSGKIVEEFEVKFEFDSKLVDHLNGLVDFVVSSQTKKMAFDLVPTNPVGLLDRYRFPFERFDNGSISRLQHIQLSFASLELPPHFSGFLNLRNLDLHLIRSTQKDLQDLLSQCFNIEWLSLVRCHIGGEIKSLSLDAYVPLTTLPSVPPCVQPLCLDVYVPLEVSSLLKNTCKFSHLKYLQLKLRLYYHDSGNILSLASFLRASPCIEKLEIHFNSYALSHLYYQPIRRLPQGEYGYLKNMHITGFVASTGELESLLHVVESASILEVLTIEAAGMLGKDIDYEGRLKVEELTRRYLDGIMLRNTKLYMA